MPPAGSLPDRAPARPRPRSRTRAATLAALAAVALAFAGCAHGARAADLTPGTLVAVADAAGPAVASAPAADPPPTAAPRTAAPRTAAPRTSSTTTEAPATTTPAPPSTPSGSPTGPAEIPVVDRGGAPVGVIRADGLGFARFGDDAGTTLAGLQQRYGAPDFDSGWATDETSTYRELTFGLLSINLSEQGGARTFTGAYYQVPGDGTADGPRLDTDPPVGLGRPDPVTFGRLTGGTPLTRAADRPDLWCFTTPAGPLCASSSENSVDGHGAPLPPSSGATVTALTAGNRLHVHCGV
jgi:hypothetical protein